MSFFKQLTSSRGLTAGSSRGVLCIHANNDLDPAVKPRDDGVFSCLSNKIIIIALFLSFTLLTGCAKKPDSVALTLVFSGDLLGELEPCGCTLEGDFGGIKRQASVVEQLRKKDPNLLLVSTGALFDTQAVTAKIKNEFILKGFQQLNYDAIFLQERDLSFGVPFLKSIPLPWLAERRLAEKPLAEKAQKAFKQEKQQIIKGIKVVFSAQAEQTFFPEQQLTVVFAKEKPKTLKGIDILILPNTTDNYLAPEVSGKTIILHPGNQGQKLGVLYLTVSPQGNIKTYRQQVLALGKNIPDAPSLKTWYDQYNQAAKNFYQARARISTQLVQKPAFVGAETCGTCHVQEMKVWQASQHSHALATLKQVNKQFDPECVGCHVVGYNKAGGFVDEFLTPQLANVQCESCHGSGISHVQSPSLNKMPDLGKMKTPVCLSCHNEKHSPVFNFNQYWPRIAH